MSRTIYRSLCLAVGMASMVAFAGCSSYVKKNDFNAAIAKLQNKTQSLQNKDQNLQQQINSLKQSMQQHFAKYGAEITAMQGRISINSIAHFGFNKSTLRPQDEPKLDEFAKIMKNHHSDALVTVEGFAGPVGSRGYNKKLGMERAEAVRNYLVNQDGMPSSQVRVVSYGEANDRLVKPHAKGPNAAAMVNRRATLVIDYAGNIANS